MEDLHVIAARNLKGKDLIALTEEAKERSSLLLEEQGISVIALALSKALMDFIQHPEEKRE